MSSIKGSSFLLLISFLMVLWEATTIGSVAHTDILQGQKADKLGVHIKNDRQKPEFKACSEPIQTPHHFATTAMPIFHHHLCHLCLVATSTPQLPSPSPPYVVAVAEHPLPATQPTSSNSYQADEARLGHAVTRLDLVGTDLARQQLAG
ncbi:hypothetical protein CRG98_047100 [Punica granatum]|uniref:Uncharacterized protein n=1 Tax=Punica granatum TaxID=22663 RepID=A0A2I0HM06_PUNGR|nr:hypothetical protein CRG98_047100 [Punica granatum]